jgi:uncharacterized protein (TIGR02646 family)
MKFIEKKLSNQPPSLVLYKKTDIHPTYDKYREKDDLRRALLHEQGYICCYCMKRIDVHNMVIEHFNSQFEFEELALNYDNMLASCTGGKNGNVQHCDDTKGHKLLTINPMNSVIMAQIKFDGAGKIFLDDDDLTKNDLGGDYPNKGILNLNNQNLSKERKVILDALRNQFLKKFGNKTATKQFIETALNKWETRNGKFKPMCQVAVYYLKKKLQKVG